MKEKSSYKINILPNNVIIQENSISKSEEKEKLEDFNKMKYFMEQIDELVKNNRNNINLTKMEKIIKDLEPFDKYFNQNLINKENNHWGYDEFIFY